MAAPRSEDRRNQQIARQLRLILAAVEGGQLQASVNVRTRLAGAVKALEALVADDSYGSET